MSAWDEILKQKFGEGTFRTSEFRYNKRIHVDAANVYRFLTVLKNDCGFNMLADLTCVDYLHYPKATDRFNIVYVLTNTLSGERVIVKTALNDPDPTIESVYDLWNGADWLEREVYDLFGVTFAGHPDLRRILMPEGFTAFPLRKDYPMRGRGERHNFDTVLGPIAEGTTMPVELVKPPFPLDTVVETPDKEYLYTLNFGPQHPATHTTLRLILTLDGETIVKAVPDIGFLHSGFEKLGEDLDFNQYVTIVDRMNYISPIANEIAWHNAVETLMGIELTPRCKYLRVIIAELARISDHLLAVGASALDLGGITAFLYAFNLRERIYNIFETMAGQRFHPSYTRVGGLLYDVNDSWIEQVRTFVREFPKTHSDIAGLLNRNRIFIDRIKGVGVLTKEEAINRSATGPVARASGVVRDIRKDEPYLAYKDFDFNVICAKGGDCFSRYLVRMDEMVESIKIISQASENIPTGPVNIALDTKQVVPDKTATYRSIEGLIQHFELFMTNRRWEPPMEEVYAATESPNGELGFYLVSNGEGRAWRARTRPPSFIHFAMFPHLIEGHQISDVPAVLGSLNIIAAELDR